MLKLAKLVFLLMFGFAATAQSRYFIFIENSLKQPFSIKVDNRNFESDGKSFINIPKLENGVYTLLISTTNSKDNKFTVEIAGNDVGFSLKQNASGNWVLFDINRFVTMEQTQVNLPINPITKQDVAVKKEYPTMPKLESKPLPIEPIIERAEKQKVDTAVATPAVAKTVAEAKVSKLYQKERKDGIDQVYVDATNKKGNTIAIFIPFEKQKIDTIATTKPVIVPAQKVENLNTEEVATKVIVVNNCLHNATESEVADFSAKLQAALALKAKLKASGVVLKEKCFTVNQIKRLSVLFANDSGKFNFFKLAQTAVSDSKNFPLLEKELKDEMIKQAFKALINP
jgi:hypothetical protein